VSIKDITSFLKAAKKFTTSLTAEKVMASEYWGDFSFLPHGATINAQYYSNLLRIEVHQAIQKVKLGKLSKIIPM
jgi:hypothetical protein